MASWKAVVLAPLAASLLVACQNKSDDAASSPPSSPYQGFWVSTHSSDQIAQCRGQILVHVRPLDAIYIQGDGAVFRYTDRQTFNTPEARGILRIGQVKNDGAFSRSFNNQSTLSAYGIPRKDIGYGMRDGKFSNFDGNHIRLVDLWARNQNREYVRTTETQLQNWNSELYRCAGQDYPRFDGQGYPRFAQIQPPNGMPQTFPPNVDPRLVKPRQDSNFPQGQAEPRYDNQSGNPPPPPENYQPGPPPPVPNYDSGMPNGGGGRRY